MTWEDRYWPKVEIGDCWLWTGSVNNYGYARFWNDGRMAFAHRFIWEQLVGAIPAGLTIDHLCLVRRCVNPDHLQPVSNNENIRRGFGWAAQNARKIHCLAGHPLFGDNLDIDALGRRICRECRRVVQARYYVKRHGREPVKRRRET